MMRTRHALVLTGLSIAHLLASPVHGADLEAAPNPRPAPLPELGVGEPPPPRLEIGPIDGMTSSWHVAPTKTSMPVGTVLMFRLDASEGERVCWAGATEVRRSATDSVAMCVAVTPGPLSVQASICLGEGHGTAVNTVSICQLDVVDTQFDQVSISETHIATGSFEIDGSTSSEDANAETMQLFNEPSIAQVRRVSDSHYRTSTNRSIVASVTVNPPGFAPLVEWSVDGHTAPQLGATHRQRFTEVGTHRIEAASAGGGNTVEVDVYRVTITPTSDEAIPDGRSVTFHATTDPPGFEHDVTWLSSTKFGQALPVMGAGASFTVQFDDTWGPHPDGAFGQWIGVRADNAAVGQDQQTIVTSTQMGTMDGEPLIFEASGQAVSEGHNAGTYFFPLIPLAEIPFLEVWAIPKSVVIIWTVDHLFNSAFDGFDLDYTIDSTTTFATGHTMTSTHNITGSPMAVADVATFSVTSPPQPVEAPILTYPIVITSLHTPAGPGQVNIATTFSMAGENLLTSTGTISLNGNPGETIPEPFSSQTLLTIFPNGDGSSGTFATEPPQPGSDSSHVGE